MKQTPKKLFRRKPKYDIKLSPRNINICIANFKFKMGKKRKVGAEIIDLTK